MFGRWLQSDPGRPLSAPEEKLARSIFGDALDYSTIRIHNRKFFPFQPKMTAMAPDGHIWFNPGDGLYCDCFLTQSIHRQGLFLHEMTHVWQSQQGIFLPLRRHPFCRYDYAVKPGQKFEKYGLEQQAELVRHTFLLREGKTVAGAPPLSTYEQILPFKPS